MFSNLSKATLARAALFQNAPVYVQFYITSRCNLTCRQCNIIYANSDVRECSLDEIKHIADNFATMKVAIVLLTGGEPFVRQDLPEIVSAFESRGVHVRVQTNGLATEEQISKVVAAGGCDVSISLDTLSPELQNEVNGGFSGSWDSAISAVSLFSRYLPKENSFASFGSVLMPSTIGEIENVIRFGTAISWFSSVVPVHTTDHSRPRGFRTFDQSLQFSPGNIQAADALIERIRAMRSQGFLLFDSDQYLDDIKRFIRGENTSWRNKNNGVCDTPNLYFAVLPNGEFAPCCDHRLGGYPVYAKDFPQTYKSTLWRQEVAAITRKCSGCMYGSYPEMTISMRYMAAKLQRFRTFLTSPPVKKWPLDRKYLTDLAMQIKNSGSIHG